jgi:hypothetical protein
VLAGGELEVLGLLPSSSNYTFLARAGGEDGTLVVYKPRRGETPLWDFPSGTLCQRETAAYLVCAAAGWGFVPPTILADGPYGVGMVQLFIDHDPSAHAFQLSSGHEAELKRIAVFDLITNNADRKAGHIFAGRDGSIWGIDHGLCFHVEPKLRTVLWDYVGEPIPEPELASVERLAESLDGEGGDELKELLDGKELRALKRRASWILENPQYPAPAAGRPYPWPPI